MRPAQPVEVQKDRLGILDPGGGDRDGLRRRDRGGRIDDEGRRLEPRRSTLYGAGSGNLQRSLAERVHRHGDLVRDFGDPERGVHLSGVGVWPRGGSGRGALETVNVAGAATERGGVGARGDLAGGGLCDGLAGVGVAQDGVGIVQDGLCDRSLADERFQILRQSKGVVGGCSLAREFFWDEGRWVAADFEWSDICCGDARWAQSGGCMRRRDALSVNRGAVRNRSHTIQRLNLLWVDR